MKNKIFFIGFLLFLVACSRSEPMHEMKHITMELHAGTQSSIQIHDLSITFQQPEARVGEESILTFVLERNGQAVTELPIMHDKPMHLILVRRDLRYFDHLHPEQREPGVYSVSHTFLAAGEYRLWIDFMDNDMQHLIDFDFKVTGSGKQMSEQDMLAGLKVDFKSPERIVQGQPATFSFTMTDEQGPPAVITEQFLAAAGHLVVIDATQQEFVHAHDETMDQNNVLTFKYTPKTVGKHRAWVQFNYNSKARTAVFEFNVHKA